MALISGMEPSVRCQRGATGIKASSAGRRTALLAPRIRRVPEAVFRWTAFEVAETVWPGAVASASAWGKPPGTGRVDPTVGARDTFAVAEEAVFEDVGEPVLFPCTVLDRIVGDVVWLVTPVGDASIGTSSFGPTPLYRSAYTK